MSEEKSSRTIWSWLFGPIPSPLDGPRPKQIEPAMLAPKEPMTREQQTMRVVAAIFGAVALYFAYDRYTNPNLDGLDAYQRCDYHAYWLNHGGSVDQCRHSEAEAAAMRMRVAAGYFADPQEAEEQMRIENEVNAAGNASGDDPNIPTDPNKKY
jgi:hypothetical protein